MIINPKLPPVDKTELQNHNLLWNQVMDRLTKELSSVSIDRWFRHVQPSEVRDNTLVLDVPDEFFKSWIIDHYEIHLNKALADLGAVKNFDIRVTPRSQSDAPDRTAQTTGPNKIPPAPADKSALNSRYTFDDFVIGPSNRFAHAACLAVSEQPAKAYNPLFIYGPVGLGKTHLMQAIGHAVTNKYRDARILYMTSEKFTNELINSIQNRNTLRFREKFRNVDVLLIDDIHFIAGKEATQEEFFHTFNALHDTHKQIVVSSDRPPKDIHGLEERLVSRFEWGLVTDIQPADFETRAAILKKKAKRDNIHVPDNVIYFIAEKVQSNIRELEGALIRVVAYSHLSGQLITESLAHEALKNYIRESQKKITIDVVKKLVANNFGIKVSDLSSKRRTKNLVFPRQIAMYITRDLTNHSLPEIGQAFGGRDHTTVLHSCDKIKKVVEKDVETKRVIMHIIGELER